jgi:Bacterial TniB protein
MSMEDLFARKTGLGVALYTKAMNEEVTTKMASFQDTFVRNPIHSRALSLMDSLAMLARKTKGRPQKILRSLGPSGAGKSTVAETFVARMNEEAEADVRVVYYSIENDVTMKRLLEGIIDKLGFKAPGGMEPKARERLMYAKFKDLGVDVLILDEAHNLVGRVGMTDIVNFFKGICNRGICSLIIIGCLSTPKLVGAESIFDDHPEVARRVKYYADIRPLTPSHRDQKILRDFLIGMNESLLAKQIFSEPSDFIHDEAVSRLLEAFDGVIGVVADLIKQALEIAIRRQAQRVEFFDLSAAIDAWAIPSGFARSNPFAGACK